MPYPHQPYYQDRRSVSDLCYDFPADEPLVEGLHAMQVHFVRNGVNVDIPVLRVMNTAHFLAAYMFATTCSGDQLEYDVLAYMSVGHDKQMMLMTMIVLAAMLKRTDGVRASQCRNVLLEDRSEDFYEGVSLYERFITSAQKRFEEQDFMTDVMAEITDLRELAEQLINEKTQLQKQITEMENQQKNEEKKAPIIYNYGTYITNDIHDNHNCPIYTTPPPAREAAQEDEEVDACLAIPEEGKYSDVRRYIEERKRIDADFKKYCDTHSRTDLCKLLTDEFGWVVDNHALGRNINRNL